MGIKDILKWFLSPAKSVVNAAPAEPDHQGNPLHRGERITVSSKRISVSRFNGNNEAFDWANADYAIIDYWAGKKPDIAFSFELGTFAYKRFEIMSKSAGFKQFEEALPKHLTGFDTARYELQKQRVSEASKPFVVWVRGATANAEVLRKAATQEIEGVERGFYLSDQDVWLEWGTFGELESHKFVHRIDTARSGKRFFNYRYTINNPTIFGIRIAALHTQMSEAVKISAKKEYKSWLVTHYWADISFGNNALDDRDILTRHFTAAFGNSEDNSWTCGNVTIKLLAEKLAPYKLKNSRIYHPYCRIEFTRKPNLSIFYESAYSKSLQLHEELRYIVLNVRLEIEWDYQDHIYSKFTPNVLKPLMQTSDQFIVWIDKREGVAGFGDQLFSHIIPTDKFKGIRFEFCYFRDHPQELIFWAVLADTDRYAMATLRHENDKKWNAIAEEITQFLPYPCETTTNYQYY